MAETLDRPEPFLETLHVLADRRGAGIGRKLLRAVAVELAARGHRALTLGVVEGNVRARSFYERLGATETQTAAAPWAPDDVIEVFYRFDDLATL